MADSRSPSPQMTALAARVLALETLTMSYSQKSVLNWRGNYNPATTYAVNDEVFSAGSSFVSLQAGNTGNAPPTNGVATTWWGMVAQAGAAGASAAVPVQRSFNTSQNPIAAPAAGTTLDEITFDTSAAALTGTGYAPVAGLDTRIKVTGPNTYTHTAPAGYTFDGGGSTWTFNSKDAYTFTKNPVNANDFLVS